MFAFECSNPVWGRTTNPYNDNFTCGGSSGGEGALLSMDGSAAGIGTDIGGSLRIPATYCGIYSLKPAGGRVSFQGAKGYISHSTTVAITDPSNDRSSPRLWRYRNGCRSYGKVRRMQLLLYPICWLFIGPSTTSSSSLRSCSVLLPAIIASPPFHIETLPCPPNLSLAIIPQVLCFRDTPKFLLLNSFRWLRQGVTCLQKGCSRNSQGSWSSWAWMRWICYSSR